MRWTCATRLSQLMVARLSYSILHWGAWRCRQLLYAGATGQITSLHCFRNVHLGEEPRSHAWFHARLRIYHSLVVVVGKIRDLHQPRCLVLSMAQVCLSSHYWGFGLGRHEGVGLVFALLQVMWSFGDAQGPCG
jgi:hypothetical protein